MRRSAGITSSPGGRCGPFHSTSRGRRPRSPSTARRNARPLSNALANEAAYFDCACASTMRFHIVPGTLCSSAGARATADARSGHNMPRAVATSVISVSSPGTVLWEDRHCVAARAQHAARPRVEGPPVTSDLDTVDDDVLDARRFAVEATEAARQIVAPTHRTLRHAGRVEQAQVGPPSFGDAAALAQPVEPRRRV